MPSFIVRPATKPEFETIAKWFLETGENNPFMRKALSNSWRRWMYHHFVVPRYLRASVYTWALEQDGQLCGYALVEPRRGVLNVPEVIVRPGADRFALLAETFRQVEQLAIEGEYEFIRAAPTETSEEGLAPYFAAGCELLDYYLYAYNGHVSGHTMPRDVTMRPLSGKQALEQRRYYLGQELDASAVAGRRLIDAALLPTRPPSHRAYEIEHDGQNIGYYAPRPDERGDGILTLVVSLLPAYWGSDVEARIVAGMAAATGEEKSMPSRVLLSTRIHCEKADALFSAIGLMRSFDIRPVMFKQVVTASPA